MEKWMMNENEAARYLGLSVFTLRQRRFKKMKPDYYKIGRSIRYSEEVLVDFLNNNKIEN